MGSQGRLSEHRVEFRVAKVKEQVARPTSGRVECFFTLPEALASSIESGQMPQTVWNRIGFVVVDEYDAFSLGTLQAEGAGLRNDRESVELKLNLSSLVAHLREPTRLYLRLSATPLAEPATQGLTKNETPATKPRLHGPSPQGGRAR